MMKRPIDLFVAAWFSVSCGFFPSLASSSETEGEAFFESKVRPLFVEHCYRCHSSASGKSKGGLLLDSRATLLRGGDAGPALVPGAPEMSLLIQVVEHRDNVVGMPPKGKLPDEQIAVLKSWIQSGAAWPSPSVTDTRSAGVATVSTDAHWAWQPLRKTVLPVVRDTDWALTPVDTFILEGLESKGLQPAPKAARHILIRRLSFDLTGLPPPPDVVESFCNDVTSDDVVDSQIERLLASPRFGERWGRHWLDVARYSDSIGGGMNFVLDDAWRYRDYVTAAFNADKPYDRFVMEQIAGDLLPTNDECQRAEQLVATGFLMLGVNELGEYEREKLRMDIVDEQLDTIGKAFLGLTLGCARCHDHKFDPVPTQDYYALAGILRSTNPLDEKAAGLFGKLKRMPLPQEPAKAAEVAIAREKLLRLKKELVDTQSALKKPDHPDRQSAENRVNSLQAEVKSQQATVDALTPMALVVGEEAQPADSPVFLRGDIHNRGPTVPRGYLTLVQLEGQPKLPQTQSGRLELSQWLTHKDHPLLARVMVNRVWYWLMGTGIVRTVDNFGMRGEQPSHPALLDYLAHRLIQSGWSVKSLVREIVMSQTYQQSGSPANTTVVIDPENRLYGRHDRRRLEAEEIHDAFLAVSDTLDETIGGPTNTRTGRLGSEGKDEHVGFDPKQRRGLYQPIYRGGLAPDLFRLFDFPDAGLVTGSRNVTTVAPQALFLLNSPEILNHSRQTADRLLARNIDDPARICVLYSRLFGRAPNEFEAQRALSFLTQTPESPSDAWAALCQSLLISNSFLFID